MVQQEREFISILEVVTRWEIEGRRLELTGPDNKGLVLFYAPAEQ